MDSFSALFHGYLPHNSNFIVAARCAENSSAPLTYRDLDHAAKEIASNLSKREVRPNEAVLIFVSNVPSDLPALLGTWRAGAVAVPVHRSATRHSIDQICDLSSIRFAITGEHQPEQFDTSELPTSAGIVQLREGLPSIPTELTDAALVMFTSGSTGEPKGVVLRRDAFAQKLYAIDEALHFPDQFNSLLALKLNFAFGMWYTLMTLSKGGTTTMLQKFSPSGFLRAIHQHGINFTAVVPTMLRSILNVKDDPDVSANLLAAAGSEQFKQFSTGGEPLPTTLAKQFLKLFPRTQIADVYGSTETCTSDFILSPQQFHACLGSIGFPTRNVDYKILNVEPGNANPRRGELLIRTPYIMTGYLGRSDLTKSAFTEGYFRTGDIVEQLESGEIVIVGRKKDLIYRGGNKISPIEIDNILISHRSVKASLTAGIEDKILGERIHSIIVLETGHSITTEEILKWAGKHLEKYKLPDHIHFSDSLPLGPTGKDDRAGLRKLILERFS